MTQTMERGAVTGTPDKDYDLLWFTTACLKNALRLEGFIEDARRSGDREVEDLLTRAQANSIKGSEEAKALLRSRIG
jgi:hypothetical protein